MEMEGVLSATDKGKSQWKSAEERAREGFSARVP